MTDVSERTTETPTEFEDLFHLVCCKGANNDLAQCGLDVSGHSWAPHGVCPDCVVCDDLSMARRCPVFGECQS